MSSLTLLRSCIVKSLEKDDRGEDCGRSKEYIIYGRNEVGGEKFEGFVKVLHLSYCAEYDLHNFK